jgi:hypothetical protein
MLEFGRSELVVRAEYGRRVNAERDRRIGAGFYYNAARFDWDLRAQKFMTGKATLAGFAIAAGAVPGDLMWDGTGNAFGWILSDNSVMPLDAQGLFAAAVVAAAHEQSHVNAARAIKQAAVPPADILADALWPEVGP